MSEEEAETASIALRSQTADMHAVQALSSQMPISREEQEVRYAALPEVVLIILPVPAHLDSLALTIFHRGIPAGYVNALEKRLAETERALFFALAEIHAGTVARDDYGSPALRQAMGDSVLSDPTPTTQQDKAKLMASWARQYEDDWSQTEPHSPTERARKRRRTAAIRHPRNQEIGLMRDGSGPDRPSFVGSGSGIYFVRAVYDILARSSGATTGVQSQLVPGEDDHLVDTHEPGLGSENPPGNGECASFWRADEVVPSGGSEASTITFEAMVDWTRSYFEIWHPAFPVLHGPEALEILEHVATNGIESLSSPDSAIVRAMISISLADARQVGPVRGREASALGPVPSDLVFHNLDHVAKSLLFVLGCPASLKNLQASLCVELFLVTMLKLNMASRLGGLVVRPYQLQLLTLLSKHAQIRGMILELRHKSVHVRQDSVERALYVQSRLTRWANEVHEVIIGEGTDDEDDSREQPEGQRGKYDGAISPLYQTLLIILQHDSTIALNRPLLAKKPATSASQAALQACICASRAIIETIDSPHLVKKDDNSMNTIVVWPLLTWSVWMSCFILTYAALEGVTSVSSAQK
ncbi:hypothetical protein VMCG_05040 [Cytospora schulzeri]|uniref:Transcription factor domain-containing protein n=1 Tax=Cytospora schulzeri TaxID=448051 RepID=A0A423WMD3_9PEZI|nr:hypothetical protein VMCG_05040 [Valsa malicola]